MLAAHVKPLEGKLSQIKSEETDICSHVLWSTIVANSTLHLKKSLKEFDFETIIPSCDCILL